MAIRMVSRIGAIRTELINVSANYSHFYLIKYLIVGSLKILTRETDHFSV